jgi:hypothetical protein
MPSQLRYLPRGREGLEPRNNRSAVESPDDKDPDLHFEGMEAGPANRAHFNQMLDCWNVRKLNHTQRCACVIGILACYASLPLQDLFLTTQTTHIL